MITTAIQELEKQASKVRAQSSVRFFKEVSDKFIGVSVPDIRMVAKRFYSEATLQDIRGLLEGDVHEHKTLALEMLVLKYEHADKKKEKRRKKEIVDFYLKNSKLANNWDLVDTSASYILGEYLMGEDLSDAQCQTFLDSYIESKNIWQRRVAIISTHAFIKVGKIELALSISKRLLEDREDLIHKAVGWTLREVWKKNAQKVEDFIRENYDIMNRTTLRYAIERMTREKRQKVLKKIF